jgi:SAM-dependent methyltransferase
LSDDQPPIDDLLARLERERLDADRRYNAALTAVDEALRAVPSLPAAPPPYDASRLPDANGSWNILASGVPTFDATVRGRLGRFVWRLIGPSLETQQQFNSAVVDHLNRNAVAHEERARGLAATIAALADELRARARFESLLVQYLQTVTAYVDTKDRSLGGPEIRQRLALTEQRLLALKRDVERTARREPDASNAAAPAAAGGEGAVAATGGATAFTGSLDSLTYVAFEDQFRGDTAEIRRRVEDYVPLFAGASNVIDVGCGRGELLEALRAQGIEARGVDVSPAMVAICRRRGFDVELGDALEYVRRQPDASAGGLIAIQVVEHFAPAYLTRFLEAAYHAMQPGAKLVLETINPACWMAFFETYIRDLTHQQPLHPETLRHLVQASGFSSVDVQYRAPVSAADRLARATMAGEIAPGLAAVVAAVNDHADKLNTRLFSSMDYVVVATR